MKAACERQKGLCKDYFAAQPPPAPGADHGCMAALQAVAHTFCQSQQQRHAADYDNSKDWTRIEVLTMIQRVEEAFESWHTIREHRFAQEFLISLLGNPKASG